MNTVFGTIYARACMGAGLSALSGLRAFLPVAFLALYSRLEFASAPVLENTPFAFLEKTWAISLFFALAVIELALDKVPALHQTRDRVLGPIKILLGGTVFAAVMASDHWITMVVCGIVGLVIAGLADRTRRLMRPRTGADTGPLVLLSAYEDVVVLVGTLLFILVPLIGALFALFLFLLVYRLHQRSKRKHKGLRILKQ